MKVSVCITHYNRPDLLFRAIESVKRQSDFVGEIIISDDCSNVDVQELIEKKYEGDKSIRFIKSEVNNGPQVARNTAIKNASYELIALMDCDDIWLNDKLKHQINFLLNNSLDLCSCDHIVDGNIDYSHERFKPEFNSDAVKFICSGGHMQTSTLLMKSYVAKNVLFDVNIRKFQDWDFIFRVAFENYKIGHVNLKLVDYTTNASDQMTKNYDPDYASIYFKQRLNLIGKKNVALLFVNRLSAMYFKKKRYISAISCFFYPIFPLFIFIPVETVRSVRRFIFYKFGW